MRQRDADDEPRDDRQDDPAVVDDLRLRPGDQDGDDHGRHAGVHALAGGGRRVHPVQREDEQDRRDEVGELDDRVAHERSSAFGVPVGLEHLQHPVGDQEAADDVGHRGEQRDRAQDADPGGIVAAGHDDRADHRDGRDGVGERHQRRVQQPRDPADHAQPDERGQHEDVQQWTSNRSTRVMFPPSGGHPGCARASPHHRG